MKKLLIYSIVLIIHIPVCWASDSEEELTIDLSNYMDSLLESSIADVLRDDPPKNNANNSLILGKRSESGYSPPAPKKVKRTCSKKNEPFQENLSFDPNQAPKQKTRNPEENNIASHL